MTEQAKKEFIQSLKQLTFFFNNLKVVHKQQDMTLEQLKELDAHMAKVEALKNQMKNDRKVNAQHHAFQDRNEKDCDDKTVHERIQHSKNELKELVFPQVVPQTLQAKYARLEKISDLQDAQREVYE